MEAQVCKYEEVDISEAAKEVCGAFGISDRDEAIAIEHRLGLSRIIDSNMSVFINTPPRSAVEIPIHALILVAIEAFLGGYYGFTFPKKIPHAPSNHVRRVESKDSARCKLDMIQSLWR